MKDLSRIRERYSCDGIAVRLGGPVANLGRIKSFAGNEVNHGLVAGLINENKFFIEWTAAEAEIGVAAELVELQVQFAGWQRNWEEIWADAPRRQSAAEQAGAWWRCVLEMSGSVGCGCTQMNADKTAVAAILRGDICYN